MQRLRWGAAEQARLVPYTVRAWFARFARTLGMVRFWGRLRLPFSSSPIFRPSRARLVFPTLPASLAVHGWGDHVPAVYLGWAILANLAERALCEISNLRAFNEHHRFESLPLRQSFEISSLASQLRNAATHQIFSIGALGDEPVQSRSIPSVTLYIRITDDKGNRRYERSVAATRN
jgi:hypothetical protein